MKLREEMISLQRSSHQERLELARKLSDLILRAHRNSVLAVYVYGSTAKNLDKPYSDLEIIAVVSDGTDIPMTKYVYRGLIIEIQYYQESSFLIEARQVGREWPISSDQFRNRIVLFENDSWLKKLDAAVAISDKADMSDSIRFAALDLVEELSVLRNIVLTGDAQLLRTRAMSLAGSAGNLVLLLNRRYVMTTSWFWKHVFESPVKPADMAELVNILTSGTVKTAQEVEKVAIKLFDEMMEFVVARGVSIESPTLIV